MKLYICDLTQVPAESDYERILTALGDEEKKRITRFRQESGRITAAVRQVMLDYILIRLFGHRNAPIRKNEYGKPFTDGIQFNITHSGDLVCLCAGEEPMGIDTEPFDRLKDHRRIMRRFSEAEQDRIEAAEDPRDEFLRVWTYREAFSKLLGIGLVLFEKEEIPIDYEKRSVRYRGRTCRFEEIPYPGYRLTFAAKESAPPPEVIRVDKALWEEMVKTCISPSLPI